MTINQRVKQVRQALNLSQAKFAKEISISNGYIAGIELENRNVNDRIIKLISATFNVNEHWLRTGEGDMQVIMSDNEETMALIARICSDDNKKKMAFLQTAAKIIDDDHCWKIIEDQLLRLIKDERE